MDLYKFESLLTRRALYFRKVALLEDQREGSYTDSNISYDERPFERIPINWREFAGIHTTDDARIQSETKARYREMVKHNREVTFVNCWNIADCETREMWNSYTNSKDGVAIQSTYARLIKSFSEYEEFDVYVGKVQYLDYEQEMVPPGGILFPFVYKQSLFAFENELRAMIWTPQNNKNDFRYASKNKYRNIDEIYVAVDLNTLVERVVVSPRGDERLFDSVAALTNKYKLEFMIDRSKFSNDAVRGQ